jgi:hypothetical protein
MRSAVTDGKLSQTMEGGWRSDPLPWNRVHAHVPQNITLEVLLGRTISQQEIELQQWPELALVAVDRPRGGRTIGRNKSGVLARAPQRSEEHRKDLDRGEDAVEKEDVEEDSQDRNEQSEMGVGKCQEVGEGKLRQQ